MKTLEQPPKKRVPFLGTPRKGWKASLPKPKQSVLPSTWAPVKRLPTSKKRTVAQWGRAGVVLLPAPLETPAPLLGRVRKALSERRWTGADFERACGLPTKTMTRIFSGRQQIGPRTRTRILKGLEARP